MKEKFSNRSTLKNFVKSSVFPLNNGLQASYEISHLIAKKGKPHTLGEEIILPSIKIALETVVKMDASATLKSIPLSNSTISRRIADMSNDVESILISELKEVKFSMQLDEATFGTQNILMSYVRYYSNTKKSIIDEFLFAKYLKTDSKGETIFRCVKEYFEKHCISFHNVTAIATDGAPSMVGKYKGFLAIVKKENANIRTVHCVCHRQHLVAKNLTDELHSALQVFIKTINKIKANPLNSRLFAKLCMENDEVFNQLLLHTEVRWLSKGNCLQRLVIIYDSVAEFLSNIDEPLSVRFTQNKNHLFYLTDIFAKFNEAQNKLQGKDITIVQSRTILLGFQEKLVLWKSSLGRRNFNLFPNMSSLEQAGDTFSDEDLHTYISHIDKLREDFKKRFKDLEDLEVPEWIMSPFNSNLDDDSIDLEIQEEFIQMKMDLEAKSLHTKENFRGFWTNNHVFQNYPKIYEKVEPFLLSFPSSYMVEAGFSRVNNILTKSRNRLDLEKNGDIRLNLTNLDPNIPALLRTHQAHPSH